MPDCRLCFLPLGFRTIVDLDAGAEIIRSGEYDVVLAQGVVPEKLVNQTIGRCFVLSRHQQTRAPRALADAAKAHFSQPGDEFGGLFVNERAMLPWREATAGPMAKTIQALAKRGEIGLDRRRQKFQ